MATENQMRNFIAKCRLVGDHLIWRGDVVHGQFRVGDKRLAPRAAAFVMFRGPLPRGSMVLSSCGVDGCVRHVEAVDVREKLARASAAWLARGCKHGHAPEETRRCPAGHLYCRVCHYKRVSRWQKRHPAEVRAANRRARARYDGTGKATIMRAVLAKMGID